MEIDLSVAFAPELNEAVEEAADRSGQSVTEWLAAAAVAKLRADGVEEVLKQKEHERRLRGLGETIAEWEAEHGAFTEEEMAAARRSLGYEDPE